MPTKKGGTKKDKKISPTINEQPQENIRERFIKEQLTKEKKLSLWLWIGVGGLAIIIVVFWGYSLWSNFTTTNWEKTEEHNILKQTSADWDQVFQNSKENELQKELTKLQIKELLNKALQQQTNNTVTTTTETSTTSTIISTTTIITTSSNR